MNTPTSRISFARSRFCSILKTAVLVISLQGLTENLQAVHGDVMDFATVERAMSGQDAVLAALGTPVLTKTTARLEGTRNIVRAMASGAVGIILSPTFLPWRRTEPWRSASIQRSF